jgi:hypothetical protein
MFLPALSLHAANLSVDRSKKSLHGEITARLDKIEQMARQFVDIQTAY